MVVQILTMLTYTSYRKKKKSLLMLALLHVFCSAAAAVVINTGLLLFGSTGIFPVDESSMGTSETVQSTGRLFDPSLSWKVLSL